MIIIRINLYVVKISKSDDVSVVLFGNNTYKEEAQILDHYQNNKLVPTKNQKKRLAEARLIARNTLAKSKHISIRLSARDLTNIKVKAAKSGLSYQTLIGMLVHHYAENKIHMKI